MRMYAILKRLKSPPEKVLNFPLPIEFTCFVAREHD